MTKTSKPFTVGDLAAIPRGESAVSPFRLDFGSLEEAFPVVDPGLRPFGDKVLVQIRAPMARTKGGLYVPEETRGTEQWNTQVAKVLLVGPVAFCNRDTLDPWPEKAWVTPGMFVRCPKYGGDRWEVPVPNSKSQEIALFCLFRDVELAGEVPEDKVLETVEYLKS